MYEEKIITVIFSVVYICFCIYSLGYDDKQLTNFLLLLSCFGAFGIVISVHSNYYIEQSRVGPIYHV